MDKLCFSIDEERYDDRHGHVLSLVGWYMHPEKKKCIFQLLGDGYEVIDIPEIERYERPDVAQSLDCLLYTSPSPRDAHESRMPSSA